MYNQEFLNRGHDEIEATIRSMARTYRSVDFYTSFQQTYPELWESFIRIYTRRLHSRPHAIKLVHSQLMHTVNDKFFHLTRKVTTIANPKGGDMSEWVRD